VRWDELPQDVHALGTSAGMSGMRWDFKEAEERPEQPK